MAQCIVTWARDVTNVRGCLSWFSAHHHCLLIYTAECIDDYFSFHWLYRINDHSYSSRIESFLTSLSFYISAREPRSKTWMRMVPSDAALISAYLFHHVHEGLLIDWVNRFNRDRSSHLWHREDINDSDGVIIMDFSNHKTHDFKWDTCSAMFQHFQKCETRYVDLFSCVILGDFHAWLHLGTHSSATHTLHQSC